MTVDTDDFAAVDGRRLRSQRNRQKIIDALVQLVEAGNFMPGAEEVADRAGVGLRSVFRHFKDMDSLYREINEQLWERISPLVSTPLEGEGWREQLDELLDRKVALIEQCLALYLVGRVHRHDSLYAKVAQERCRAMERKALSRIWPSELNRDKELFEGVDMLLSFDTWARLRQEQGLSIRRSKAVIRRLIEAALAACGHPLASAQG